MELVVTHLHMCVCACVTMGKCLHDWNGWKQLENFLLWPMLPMADNAHISCVEHLWYNLCTLYTLACSVDQTFKLGQKECAQMRYRVELTIPLLWGEEGIVIVAVWSMSGLSMLLVSAVVLCQYSSAVGLHWVLTECLLEGTQSIFIKGAPPMDGQRCINCFRHKIVARNVPINLYDIKAFRHQLL